jgi:hypothetical protein
MITTAKAISTGFCSHHQRPQNPIGIASAGDFNDNYRVQWILSLTITTNPVDVALTGALKSFFHFSPLRL